MCDIVTTCDSKHGQAIACRLKALSCTASGKRWLNMIVDGLPLFRCLAGDSDFSRLFCIFVCAGL